jgi:hypothetical protein
MRLHEWISPVGRGGVNECCVESDLVLVLQHGGAVHAHTKGSSFAGTIVICYMLYAVWKDGVEPRLSSRPTLIPSAHRTPYKFVLVWYPAQARAQHYASGLRRAMLPEHAEAWRLAKLDNCLRVEGWLQALCVDAARRLRELRCRPWQQPARLSLGTGFLGFRCCVNVLQRSWNGRL